MLPKKGTVFPGQSNRRKARLEYASLVAKAMRSELGGTHQAIKTVMRWTGAGERTVKNWFNAEKGPSGAYLLRLIHESDGVLLAVLRASGRDDVVGAIGRGIADNRRSTTDFRKGALPRCAIRSEAAGKAGCRIRKMTLKMSLTMSLKMSLMMSLIVTLRLIVVETPTPSVLGRC